MGIQTGLHVYGWRKPTITLSLVAGGSLLPNTKYYVVGLMSYTMATYIPYGGPISDVEEITTTTNDLSIQITQKTYRDITVFADNGDSRTLATCTRHCLLDTDQIKIDSGSYSGTWDVDEWVNYNQFIIDTPYVDNVPVQCYSDTNKYNLATGNKYWVGTASPLNGSEWVGGNNWTKRPWDVTDTNPVIITAQPSLYLHSYSVHPQLNGGNRGYHKILEDYGNVSVIITDTGVNLQKIYDEVQYSGFVYNCGYGLMGYNNVYHFHLAGCVRVNGEGGFTSDSVAVEIWGEIYGYIGTEITFNGCGLFFPLNTFSAAWHFTANNCTIYNNSNSNTYNNWVYGNGTVFYAVPRIGSTVGDETGLFFIDGYTGDPWDYVICRNKEFRNIGIGQQFQVSYNTARFEDCVIKMPFYWIFSLGNTQSPIYMIENVSMYYADNYTWNFRFYSYATSIPIRIMFLNVDSPEEPDNKKRIINNSLVVLDCEFYRRVEIYVQDDGFALESVGIHIIDNEGNEYTGSTDENGYAYLDVLEQKHTLDNDDGIHGNWLNYDHDTFYSDFIITLTKNNYHPVTLEFENISGNKIIKTGMESTLPVYTERQIAATIEEDIITGKI